MPSTDSPNGACQELVPLVPPASSCCHGPERLSSGQPWLQSVPSIHVSRSALPFPELRSESLLNLWGSDASPLHLSGIRCPHLESLGDTQLLGEHGLFYEILEYLTEFIWPSLCSVILSEG